MKRTHKMLAWILLAAMPMTGAACAESVQRAAAPVELCDFEHYPSFTGSSETGRWSLRANEADALVYRFEDYVDSSGGEFCAFWLEARGSLTTGLWSPVLCVRYAGYDTVDARAISILADGVRYDLAARTASGEGEPELICAPLTLDAVNALRSLSNAADVQLRLLGEENYTAKIDPDTTNSRRRIEAASLAGIGAGLQLMDNLGVQQYALWDLTAADWENQHGFSPAFSLCKVENTLGEAALSDDFGMIEYGDQTTSAREAQQILIDAGFLSGSAASTYGRSAREAALRAQQYLGMVETGCVDAQLARSLAQGRIADEQTAIDWRALGDSAQISIDRFWLADGVSAINNPASVQTAYNSDNVLLAADGWIRNISAGELKLFSGVEAKAVFGGKYEYEATVLCEANGGTALDMSLLPMAQARLIVYAEVPPELAKESGWIIRLSAGDAALEYVLE